LLAVAGGLGVVIGLYLWLGRPELIGSSTPGAAVPHETSVSASAPATGGKGGAGPMDVAVARLETRLAQGKGTDADWDLLAKSYDFLGRSADAAAARAKHLPAGGAAPVSQPVTAMRPLDAAARKLLDQANSARQARKYAEARDLYARLAARGAMNADAWADYADVSASLNGGRLAGEPEKFISEALALDPQHTKALWLQGSALHESGRYADAVGVWQRLAALLDPASSDGKLIASNIAEDRRLAGNAVPGAAAGAVAPAAVSGEIALADALKSRATPGLTLFVVAKSVDQPGMPVAVLRTVTSQWPLHFKLDDSLSMMPTRPLSGAGRVTIEARISKSGQAMPAAGDLQGSSGVIDPKAGKPLRIVIDAMVN
jgi:cytochrome c-type biogenesis protein CcmH